MTHRRTVPTWVVAALACAAARAATPIPLVGGDITPSKNLQAFESVVKPVNGRYSAHALVVLPLGWTAAIDAKLRALGVVVLRHTYDRAFLATVRGTRAELEAALADLGIEIAPITAGSKISPSLAIWKFDPGAAEPGGRIRALVRVYDDVTAADASRAFASAGVTPRPSRRCPCWEVALTDAERDRLAREDAVSLIEPNDTGIRWLVYQGRPAVGAEAIQGYSWNGSAGAFTGLTGLGVTVGVLDEGGLPTDHPAFWSMGTGGALTGPSRITANAAEVSDHTAHIAGMVAGSGGDSPANYGGGWSLRGVAPRASLAVVVAAGNEFCANQQAIVEHSADLTNNSYGFSLYNAVSFATDNDAIVRGDAAFDASCGGTAATQVPARLSIWGAGNNGTTAEKGDLADRGYWSVLNPQKNGLVVGGSLVDPASSPIAATARWDDSSIGPTLDGRLKPDVVAPACKKSNASTDKFFRTVNGSANAYTQANAYEPANPCGTSYSTAFVTGVAALLLEQWRTVYGPLEPHPSTLKAVLIQGSVDIVGDSYGPYSTTIANTRLVVRATKGPDFATGYGEVSAVASAAVIVDHRLVEDRFLVAGDSATYTATVPSGAQRLRVTLAWDDRKASDVNPTAAKLVNDLDLELYGPLEASPALRRPWVLPTLPGPASSALHVPDRAPSGLVAAVEGTDDTNNVEQVEVDAPRAGTWEVRVKATKLPDQNGQTFSLAADFPLAAAVQSNSVHESLGNFVVSRPEVLSTSAISAAFGLATQAVVIPARFACRVPGRCTPCERFAICPLIVIEVDGIPERWDVRLIDTKGKTLAKAKRHGNRARVTWDRGQARNALIAITPPKKGLVAAPAPKTPFTISARPAS